MNHRSGSERVWQGEYDGIGCAWWVPSMPCANQGYMWRRDKRGLKRKRKRQEYCA